MWGPLLLGPSIAAAQSSTNTTLTYISGSSVKMEQLIGDVDWAAAAKGVTTPTTSRTVSRFNILGNDIGSSFEDNGKLIFIFGDTISATPGVVNFGAHDPIAWSTTTNPESGLLLNFYTNNNGSPLFVEPPGVAMGADDVPNAGISLADGVYLICSTGSDTSLPNPQAAGHSVLARFDEPTQTFTTVRTVSATGGKFINVSLHVSGSSVLMFGAGPYRASDIYLAMTPSASFASGQGTVYFAGLVGGQPTWAATEGAAVPVVQDNPLHGPAWPNDSPSVGNLSVVYSSALQLWLMTYDGGRQTPSTNGTYLAYARQPWGPWSTPQLIFNRARDNAYGVFIHNPSILPDPPGDGLNGPTIGGNDIYATAGGDYAPLMIERFTSVVGNRLNIYYTLSTWNPYTVVLMRSSFTVTSPPASPANYQGLWWKAPAASESGWGINLAHQGSVIFATWFTYDPTGAAWWLSMTANQSGNNTYSGTLYATSGPPFDATPFDPALVVAAPVGTGTLAFSDANDGSFAYTVNGISQTKAITREVFGPLPTCTFGAQPNLALADNYQDLWWNPAESGWGVNLAQEGTTLFATWFTYAHDGTPLWLSATAPKLADGSFSGPLYRTAGPAFSAVPFNPTQVVLTAVGTATFRFLNGNSGTFSYTVSGEAQSKPIQRQVFRSPGTVCL